MNFFRVPLNCIVVIVLANIGGMSEFQVFTTCVLCLVPALVCQWRLAGITAADAANRRSGEAQVTETELGVSGGTGAATDAAAHAAQTQPLTAPDNSPAAAPTAKPVDQPVA